MNINEILERAMKFEVSDIHLTAGLPPIIREYGELIRLDEREMTPEDLVGIAKDILSEKKFEELNDLGAVDVAYSISNVGRFRVNVFVQRGSYAVAIRVVALEIPTIDGLGLPEVLKELADLRRGLILVTGPTGSGKSTTLAAMINYMNEHRNEHIITIEDPIEFLHKHGKCMINQREIGNDTFEFSSALRSALRQDPDVILVGEMRDLETISTAITAAETGHLVLSTVHTIGAANTIERIVDVFPPYQQQQIKVQLSSVLKGVISQQILPKANGEGRVAAFEILRSINATQNLIREGKAHQLQTVIQTNSRLGMVTMDASLIELYNSRTITKDNLLRYSIDTKAVKRQIGYL